MLFFKQFIQIMNFQKFLLKKYFHSMNINLSQFITDFYLKNNIYQFSFIFGTDKFFFTNFVSKLKNISKSKYWIFTQNSLLILQKSNQIRTKFNINILFY